mmetsp:Transcript_16175/g.38776  ORF Transcript_16175/g.38776 Transcript_16175/m.38776 type:complete len:300 (+) Transcript_16175:347-1246(+)
MNATIAARDCIVRSMLANNPSRERGEPNVKLLVISPASLPPPSEEEDDVMLVTCTAMACPSPDSSSAVGSSHTVGPPPPPSVSSMSSFPLSVPRLFRITAHVDATGIPLIATPASISASAAQFTALPRTAPSAWTIWITTCITHRGYRSSIMQDDKASRRKYSNSRSVAPRPGGGGTGTDFMECSEDDDEFVAVVACVASFSPPMPLMVISPPSSAAALVALAAPSPFDINPLENATLTTPRSYLSHREIRGAMGPCTAHITWVSPARSDAEPSEREREESSAERGRRAVGLRLVFGRG